MCFSNWHALKTPISQFMWHMRCGFYCCMVSCTAVITYLLTLFGSLHFCWLTVGLLSRCALVGYYHVTTFAREIAVSGLQASWTWSWRKVNPSKAGHQPIRQRTLYVASCGDLWFEDKHLTGIVESLLTVGCGEITNNGSFKLASCGVMTRTRLTSGRWRWTKNSCWVKITWVLRQGWQGTNPATVPTPASFLCWKLTTPRVLLTWPQRKSLRRTPTSRRPLHQVQDQGGLRWVVRRCRSTGRRSLRVSSDLPRSASDWEDHQAAGCWLKNQRGKKIGKCNLCSSVMLCGVHVLYIAVMLFVVDVFWFCFKRCYLCSIEFVSIKYLIVKCHVIFAPREIWAPDIFSNVDGNGEKRWILSIVDLTFWVMSTWRFEWCR